MEDFLLKNKGFEWTFPFNYFKGDELLKDSPKIAKSLEINENLEIFFNFVFNPLRSSMANDVNLFNTPINIFL